MASPRWPEREQWHRPWALLASAQSHDLGGAPDSDIPVLPCGTWLYLPQGEHRRVSLNGRAGGVRWLYNLDGGREVVLLPIPLRPSAGIAISLSGDARRLIYPGIPDKPLQDPDLTDPVQRAGVALLDRVKAVWARLRDVEMALADPALLWQQLAERWLSDDQDNRPEMDVIVHQAGHLRRILDTLGNAPRRVLRRTHRMTPLSRVQELDRRAMTWLTRQPGETTAERAGSHQRILAVAREESIDTLENRVLHSYAVLAGRVARDYVKRHPAASSSHRVRLVDQFARQCRALHLDLQDRAGLASPVVTPNFVLQNNPDYRAMWFAWWELLNRERVGDELWRWQARSWEEFCALAVVVALQSMDGARLIASSPLMLRTEQDQGCWLHHINPLAVFYLPALNLTIEVSYRPERNHTLQAFGAPLWLRFGSVDDNGFLTRCAIWPLWHAEGGLDLSDLTAIPPLLSQVRGESVRAGIVIRPARAGAETETCQFAPAFCVTLGADGPTLPAGLRGLRDVLVASLGEGLG